MQTGRPTANFAPMHLTLRRATTADAALVADLSRQTFVDTFAAHNTEADMRLFLDEQFTKGRLMLEVGAPENTFLLAETDGAVAGYLKLRDGRRPAALHGVAALEIARLYAVKDFIGKGIGAALMQAAVDEAQRQQKAALWLGVWEHNHRAIGFYQRWGFEKIGEWEFLLGTDRQLDWLMRKWV